MERITQQKKCILKYLQSVSTHPTADEVYVAVRKEMPHISKGTVYRNLDFFVQRGLIKEIPGAQKRFDADLSVHSHFLCQKCDQIIDIFGGEMVTYGNIQRAHQCGVVKGCEVYFYGICQACQ